MKYFYFLFALALPTSAFSDDRRPLQVSNQNPLVRIYGLPQASLGKILEPGQQSFSLTLDAANNFTNKTSATESVYLDGESTQTTLRWSYGFKGGFKGGFKNWQAGLTIPLVRQSSGTLDAFIDRWHSWFDLPEGGRDLALKDQFIYRYSRNNVPLLQVNKPDSGLGDIRLSAAYALSNSSHFDIALKAEIKLPTGDSKSLLGSGGLDANLGLALSDDFSLEQYRASYFLNAGVMLSDSGEVLSQLRKNTIFYFSAGLAKDFFQNWQLKLQLDGHTKFYESDLAQLGDSIQLSVGGALKLEKNWQLDFAVSEDIVVGSASDVSFHLSLSNSF